MCGRYSVVTKKISKEHRQAARYAGIINDLIICRTLAGVTSSG